MARISSTEIIPIDKPNMMNILDWSPLFTSLSTFSSLSLFSALVVFISFPGSSGIMFPVVVCTFVMSCKVIPADFVVVNVVVVVLSVVVVTVVVVAVVVVVTAAAAIVTVIVVAVVLPLALSPLS